VSLQFHFQGRGFERIVCKQIVKCRLVLWRRRVRLVGPTPTNVKQNQMLRSYPHWNAIGWILRQSFKSGKRIVCINYSFSNKHDNMALRHTAELPSLKSSDLLLQTNKVANSSWIMKQIMLVFWRSNDIFSSEGGSIQ